MSDTAANSPADGAIAADLAAGLAHHKAGRLGDAAPHYRRVLRARPNHAEANNLLGLVLLATGDSPGAAERLEKAVAAAPDNPQFLCNAAVALDAVLQHEKAVQLLGRAIELKPDYAEAHSNLGLVLKRMRRYEHAAASYRRAIELRPGEAGFHFNLGNTLVDLGELHEAETAYRNAIELRPGYALALAALATLLEELGRPEQAAAIAEKSLEFTPVKRDGTFHKSRAHAYRLAGKLHMAEESFRKALGFNPDDIEAWEGLSRTVCWTEPGTDLDTLLSLRSSSRISGKEQIDLDVVLGRYFDDLGEFSTSFEYFSRANAAFRKTLYYSAARNSDDLARMQSLFDPVPVNLPPRSGGPGPIFIVGEPRSGKTTLEGMLSRHPRTTAVGELRFLQMLSADLWSANDLGADGSHIGSVHSGQLARLGKAYMDSVLPMIPAGQIPIDTMPPNYRLIGFIRMALPDARVIQTRRDRVDLAIALFQKRFPALWYGYTYNLPELGQHLRAYDRLMSWWHQAFPGFIFDADVSKLGTEASMRELLAFCGLEWDSACLAPHESEPRLGDDPIRAAARRERRRTFYEPLLRPYLAGSEAAAVPG